jgi:predicted Zn-dependent protease
MNATLATGFKPKPLDLKFWLNKYSTQFEWVGLRHSQEITHTRSFRDQKSDQHHINVDYGLMIEILSHGQFFYAGTSDLSPQGIESAFLRLKKISEAVKGLNIFNFTHQQRPTNKGKYQTVLFKNLDSELISDFCQMLCQATKALQISDQIKTAKAVSRIVELDQTYLTSNGSEIFQQYTFMTYDYSATANNGYDSQTRSTAGGLHTSLQTGLEIFDPKQIFETCRQIASEAIELVNAENCPSDTRDLLLSPDQMLMQIHESIGHPLELDRILGDERNYAGWSFVKPQDFGKLQYGSKKLNVCFEPNYPGEFASYNFDDSGNKATKEFLIKDGILQRGLGSLESQARSKIPGVANFRSASWNRAPIDRMANINVVPGTDTMDQMISNTESGILMKSNSSWSIDDYRNKFQFGCEYGRLIKNGKLAQVVKNPGYRGSTTQFWNQLAMVGSDSEFEIYGSPYCGKGEPNQIIRVGHGSPPCLFKNIEVFGGGH